MKKKEFQELLQSIDEAREIHRGERKPSRVFHFDPQIQTKDIREKLGLTQAEFADMLGVSLGTLRNWEQGRTYPDGPALSLLKIAKYNPKALLEALHA